MTNDDSEHLMSALINNFPNQKWDDGDLAVWIKNFRSVDVEDVVTALIEHRNTSRFSPKIGEIRALLEKSRGQPVATQRQGDPLINAWRDQICEGYPNLRNISDTEVVLRYHRACYLKQVRALNEAIDRNAGAAVIEDEKRRVDRIHGQLVNECQVTLNARCNHCMADAINISTYIDTDSDGPHPIIDWIRGVTVAA